MVHRELQSFPLGQSFIWNGPRNPIYAVRRRTTHVTNVHAARHMIKMKTKANKHHNLRHE